MIRSVYRHRSGTVVMDLPPDQLAKAVRESGARLWIDLTNPTEQESHRVLTELYQIHPLAVEDAVKDSHLPKLDDYGGYLYLVFHTLVQGDELMDIHTEELDVLLGPNFLITMHEHPRPSIELLCQPDHHDESGLAQGPAFLLYQLLSRQVDGYIPLLDQFEERLEALGDHIFLKRNTQGDALLNDILTAQSSALRVRRVLQPQSDLLYRLAHHEYSVIPAEVRIYFQDLYDDVARLSGLSESMRDLARSTIDTYQALTNNRLGDVMRMLTIISTIFMPLSFLAGVYGMNIPLPGQSQSWFFAFTVLVFLLVAGSMIWYFRRNRWL
jgi:magnesium transporter